MNGFVGKWDETAVETGQSEVAVRKAGKRKCVACSVAGMGFKWMAEKLSAEADTASFPEASACLHLFAPGISCSWDWKAENSRNGTTGVAERMYA